MFKTSSIPSINSFFEVYYTIVYSFTLVLLQFYSSFPDSTALGERDELAPGSAYKAPTLSAEERVVVKGLTRRRRAMASLVTGC